ncbi:hypothetical protein ES705_45218 [subsurface metagenome]
MPGLHEKWKDNLYTSKKAKTLFNSSITALFKLANKYLDDIVSIIEDSLSRDKMLHGYDKPILENVLSYIYSPFLCIYIPDIVCKVANEYWLNRNELKQFNDISMSGSPYSMARHIDVDEIFGLSNEIRFKISQPLPTSTFILHLLNTNLIKGVVFLVDFFNYSIKYYQKYYSLIPSSS